MNLRFVLASLVCAPALAAATIAPAPEPTGELTISVACAAGTAEAVPVAFGLPFPRGFLSDAARVRIDDARGDEVAIDVVELARWRHLGEPRLDGTSLRSVLVSLRHDCAGGEPVRYRVQWGVPRSREAALGITPANVAERTWGPQAAPPASEHPETDNYARDVSTPALREPRAWVTLPRAWLAKLHLRGPVAPASVRISDDWHTGFMRTYVNDVAADVARNETNDNGQGLIDWSREFEGWLYDRPAVLWNAYVRTGDPKWHRHAHRASQYYAANVATAGRPGSFSKRPDDPKYAHGVGLYIAYLLSGDARLLEPIRAVAKMVATVPTRLPPIERTTGLWTERQVSVALAGALAAWEATGESGHAERVRQVVRGLVEDTTRPPSGYPAAATMAGVLLHRPEVHEGATYPDLVISPWMAALMLDALWRYWQLSDDPAALRLLADYARFVAARAVVGEGVERAPAYLAGLKGVYGGIESEHAYDVLGLVARGRWAAQRLGQPTDDLDAPIRQLRATADAAFATWVRNSPGLPRYRAAPTRKIGWWFGSTYDLAWLGQD